MTTPHTARPWLTAVDPLAAIPALAAAVLIVIGGWQILQARDEALAEAEHTTVTLARALAEHAGRTIEAVDLTLIDAVDRVESRSEADGFRPWLVRRASILGQVRNIVEVGADGDWVSDSAPHHGPLSSADRPYFAWHRDHASRDLHLGEPLVSRVSGQPVLPVSRRIDNPDGTFGGLVVANLAPDFFERFYRSVTMGSRGTIAIWTAEGRLLLRYPAPAENAGSFASPIVAEAFLHGSGSIQSRSPIDGIERRTAFERVGGLPLVVSASLSTADALANWSRSAFVEALVLSGAALALVALGLGLGAHRRRMGALRSQSRLADARYRMLAENASDLVTLLPSLAGSHSYVTPSSRLLLGWEPEELAVKPLRDTTHPDDIEALEAKFAHLTPESPRAVSHHRARHQQGHYVWVEAVMTLTADGVLTATRDITARREAEQRLADSEGRFRSLADASSDMIQQLDLAGYRHYVSPASVEIFGRAPSALVGTHPADFIIDDDAPRVRSLIAEVGGGRIEQARSVHQIRHAAGHHVYVEVQFRLVRDRTTGQPLEIVSSVRDITARETLQRQHAEANRRLRLAEEMAHLGHWRVEQPSGKLTWSDEVFRIHGVEPASFEPTVDRAVGFYHPADRVMVDRLVSAALEARQPFGFGLRVVRPSGEMRDVLSRGLCEVGPDGAVAAVFGTIMDVTDLRAAERAATASEARYRLLADNATDMVTQMDLDGRQLFVSPGSRELLGFAPEELVGTNPLAMVHHDDTDGLQAVLADLAGGRLDRAINVNRLQHRDGRWIWVEASIRLIREDDAQAKGFVAAMRDVTDRKQAHEALQASEGRYRVLAEATTDVITQLDLSLRRQYVSPACRHLLGFEPEEMLGLRLSTSIHPDDADAVQALAVRLAAGEVAGDRVVTTYRTLHKLDHWIWVEAGMTLIRDPTTRFPLSLICSLRDVTVRQEAAHQMERAKAAAEHAVRVKSDFVANVSHELRTPLTGILGVHDLLRRDPTLGPAQRRLVKLASDAGTSLLAIVNDVLDFSKIEAGLLDLETVPFDLGDLVASCRDLAGEGLGGKAVEIRVWIHPAMPRRLVGDPTRLRQVLLNLMTNAVKFTERGHVEVRLAYRSEEGRLRVDVVDTGIGIPADRLNTLFDRFTQADSSMSRRYGGTGLGLAICRRLVELMGGRIDVERPVTDGAHFWFELPVKIHDGAVSPVEPAVVDRSTVGDRHLLLAEDNALNAEIIGKMLESRGYTVTIVPDGAAAVAAVAGSTFALVLMDLQMPVMDGLSATVQLRRDEATAGRTRLPIIGLTANATVDDAARCLAAGMNAHVAKPIVWQDLFAAIDRQLDAGSSAAAVGLERSDADLDTAALEDLAVIIGRDRLADILGRFASALPVHLSIIADGEADHACRQAHMLTSMAGQLGFMRLSKLASAIERQPLGASHAALLRDFRVAIERAAAAAEASPFLRAG